MNKPTNIKAIIGLGNPGNKYRHNRHNIGFRIVETLADRFSGTWSSNDLMEQAEVFIDSDLGKKIILIKPLTFMNTSGRVLPFLSKKGIRPEEILVVHDELEKKFGHISVRLGGSAKGHNGLRSIMNTIGKEFWRLRFGIDRPEDRSEVGNYVLSNFSAEEEEQIPLLIDEALDLIL